jgi:amidase/aspartyl-tRNA(Asn)/glutamyl-tRNA(Gln) amidotransferase subunit A
MKNEDSLAFATIEELSALLARHKLSPVELTEMYLRRIERQNPALNAILTVTAEQALAAARKAEKHE